MYWQRETYKSPATWTRNQSITFDLPAHGLVTGIVLHGRGTPVNDARNATKNWRFMDGVNKIEVIGNGSTVITNLTAPILHGMNWLDGGPGITDQHHNYATSTLRWHAVLLFGRYYMDPEIGLDLDKWDGVQLKLTNDWTSTYFSADHTLDVIPCYLRAAAAGAFSGYMKREIWKTYTTVASDVQYYDLPVGYRIRRVVVQTIPKCDSNNVAARTPYQTLSKIELYLKTGTLKVWSNSLRELWYDNLFSHGRYALVGAESYHTDGKGIWTGLGQTLYKAGARMSHDGTQTTWATDLEPGNDSSTQTRQCDSDSDQDSLLLAGLSMENCAEFRFAQPDAPDGYLDPEEQKTVQMAYTIGSDSNDAGGTINTILESYVPR